MNVYTKEWWQKNTDCDVWTHISTVNMSNRNPIIFINGVQQPDEPMTLETETRTRPTHRDTIHNDGALSG